MPPYRMVRYNRRYKRRALTDLSRRYCWSAFEPWLRCPLPHFLSSCCDISRLISFLLDFDLCTLLFATNWVLPILVFE